MLRIGLLLVGYGNVARRFVELIGESRDYLADQGLAPIITGVVTRHHGCVFEAAGLAPKRIAQTLTQSDSGDRSLAFVSDCLEQMRSGTIETRVLVETTTLDVRSGEPAISHVRAAVASGAHVITANKGPAAFAYQALAAEAAAANVSFLFEGAVMDGIPIFNFVRETMPGVIVNGFRGVVNSTTNYLLSAMEEGEAFDAALARMQAAGVAEADASLDVDGWDAAAKTAALANVLLDASLTPQTIDRISVTKTTGERARSARAVGRRLKVVVSARGRGSDATGAVELVELAADDPLAILDGQANALELDTWPLGRVVVTQRDGGMEKTAYALFSDLMTIGRRAAAGRPA